MEQRDLLPDGGLQILRIAVEIEEIHVEDIDKIEPGVDGLPEIGDCRCRILLQGIHACHIVQNISRSPTLLEGALGHVDRIFELSESGLDEGKPGEKDRFIRRSAQLILKEGLRSRQDRLPFMDRATRCLLHTPE